MASGTFNAASYFIDRHLDEGRGAAVAIECGDRRITYQQLHDEVNRVGTRAQGAGHPLRAARAAAHAGRTRVRLRVFWRHQDWRRAGAAEYALDDSRLRVRPAGLRRLRHHYQQSALRTGHRDRATRAGRPPRPCRRRRRRQRRFPDSKCSRLPRRHCWRRSQRTRTPRASGCIPRAVRDRRRPASTFSTTWPCVPRPTRGRCSTSSRATAVSAWRSCSSHTGSATRMYFPAGGRRDDHPVAGPGDDPRRLSTSSSVIGRRCSSRCRHTTRCCWLTRCPGREFDLSSIRCAVSAGEALPPALFERFRQRFGIEILDGIGSTEILHIFISNRRGDVRPGSSGRVVSGYEARIVDEDGRAVPPGEIGDLLVRGRLHVRLLLESARADKDTIAGHWIRTGDKYRQDEDGFFWFAGRSDDMLKVGGIWVSPAEVEHALLEHPAVEACGVTGREDSDGLVKPMAHVVARAGVAPGAELAAKLQRFARDAPGGVQASALDRVRRRAADNRHGKDSAFQATR